MSHLSDFVPVLCLLSFLGCSGGESTQERMLRMARERAAFRTQTDSDVTEDEQFAAQQKQHDVDTPTSDEASKEDLAVAKKIASKPKSMNASETAKPGPAPPSKNEVAANSDGLRFHA